VYRLERPYLQEKNAWPLFFFLQVVSGGLLLVYGLMLSIKWLLAVEWEESVVRMRYWPQTFLEKIFLHKKAEAKQVA